MKFPLTYEVELVKTDGEPIALAAGRRPIVTVTPPPEWGGGDAQWSPEHLLVSALAACFTTTFVAVAEHAKVHVGAIRCKAMGILDHVGGVIAFASMELAVEVRVLGDDVARTHLLLEDAKARCFVANSLRCHVELVTNVVAS